MLKIATPALAMGIFLGLLAVNAADAQPRAQDGDGWNVRLGALGGYMPDYEGSDDYEFKPIPDVEITYGDRFFFDRRGLGANLITGGPLTAGVTLGFDAGRDADENRALRGLGDVKATAIAGGFVNYTLDRWIIGADIGTDILGEGHEGTTASLSLSYMLTPGERTMIFIGPSITWASDNYMQSYFGINTTQAARSGRAAYEAEAGFKNAGLTAFGIYKLSDNWALTGLAGYSRLMGDAADSPIVDRDGSADQFFGALGLSYSF